jgi:DUF1680 family protein
METQGPTFIVDTSRSPYVKLLPVPVENARLEDAFWAPRLQKLRKTTIPTQYQMIEETGRLSNFRRASGKEGGEFKGRFFNDSDVYKWVEAVAFSLASGSDKELCAMAGRVIADIAAAQGEDGYLNTYFMFGRKGERWTNLRDMHELYCAGHLIQAAVAFYRATGERSLLEVACRFADHIAGIFGLSMRSGTPGHPEIEMALVELYRATGKKTYLELSRFLVDKRGVGLIGGSPYHIDHKPFREQTEIVGHAVRSVYLNCGAADIYMETGDDALWDALLRLWHSMAERRMYVTGGVGSRHHGEAFGEDHELPNITAYAETCAAIANVMWNWRMLLISGEGRFADLMELALYNGFLSGISLDGEEYFYVNPLADRGRHRRERWFSCACCPPNIARLLASLPGYFYSSSSEGIGVHLYAQGTAQLSIKGNSVALVQRTEYPWKGRVDIEVKPQSPESFSLFLRIPGWCREAEVLVNGEAFEEPAEPGKYLEVRRTWKPGDRVELLFPMPIERVACHPFVLENADRVVLRRGPLIYCVERADNPGCDPWSLILPICSPHEVEWMPGLLGGVMAIKGEALVISAEEREGRLYRMLSGSPPEMRRVGFMAIPYYAWANREAGSMAVWIRSKL